MPRCFMAKKLKYPYEQWKESQVRKSASRSPSPMGGVAGGDPMSDGDEDEEMKGTLMRVVKDSRSKGVRSHALKNKSAKHTYAARKICSDLEEWGHGPVLLKSDGEPSIRALKKKIKTRREGEQTLMEVTPRGDPKANGEAESAVREIKGVARAIKVGLEQRIGRRLPADAPILPWIVEHAGVCVTAFRKGPDGKTPYRRIKGKEFSGQMMEMKDHVQRIE